jgi:PAS domain-containing protein
MPRALSPAAMARRLRAPAACSSLTIGASSPGARSLARARAASEPPRASAFAPMCEAPRMIPQMLGHAHSERKAQCRPPPPVDPRLSGRSSISFFCGQLRGPHVREGCGFPFSIDIEDRRLGCTLRLCRERLPLVRSNVEQMEQHSTERLANLLTLSYEPMLVWRLDGTVEFWNSGAERLYGFPSSEAVGTVSHARSILPSCVHGSAMSVTGPANFAIPAKTATKSLSIAGCS